MKYVIDKDLAQEILNYLGTKPFQEVAVLITKLQSLQTVSLVSSDAKPPPSPVLD